MKGKNMSFNYENPADNFGIACDILRACGRDIDNARLQNIYMTARNGHLEILMNDNEIPIGFLCIAKVDSNVAKVLLARSEFKLSRALFNSGSLPFVIDHFAPFGKFSYRKSIRGIVKKYRKLIAKDAKGNIIYYTRSFF